MIPILIGGTGRCGTTILRKVLGCHPQVVSLPLELRIIVDPDGAVDLVSALSERWSPYRADRALFRFQHLLELSAKSNFPQKLIADVLRRVGISSKSYVSLALEEWFGSSFFRLRVNQLMEQILRDKTRGSWIGSEPYQIPARIYEAGPFEKSKICKVLADFFHDLFRHRSKDDSQTHWLEDTPENLLCYRELAALFTNMRFIHILRDPRDVVASYRRFRWGGGKIEIIAQRILQILNQWLETRSELSSEQYVEVRLEDLSLNGSRELERICEFIGLPMVSDLLRIPLNQSNSGRWRLDLSEDEIGTVEAYLAPIIREYGYE